jgi:hypothetical protein
LVHMRFTAEIQRFSSNKDNSSMKNDLAERHTDLS